MRWLNGITDSMDMSLSKLQRLVREGSGTPLQYSCQENPMDRGACRATVHGAAKSRMQLSDNSHPYMTTGKTIALTRWNFVGKVMSLLFNILSRLVITFCPRSKRFLNFMAAVTIRSDIGAPENKFCHCFHCFPIYLP